MVKKAIALLLLPSLADGFRVRPKRKNTPKHVDTSDSTANPSAETLEQEKVRRFVEASRELGRSMPRSTISSQDIPYCVLAEGDCNIQDMTGPTFVFPGTEDSKCLSGEYFGFLVKPGRTDKLHFYFPGGGACWKGSNSNAELCFQSLEEGLGATGLGTGVSSDRADNPFSDFTFVAPAYCDGGAYVSDTTLDGKPQTGYTNVKYTADWAKKNLDRNLASFVISGSSAGALGTMAWSNTLLSDFRYSKASVIVDSYMGVFPDGTQGPTIKNFGACPLPIWDNFRSECEAETSNIQDIFDYTISSNPGVAFAMIQPKEDIVQVGFYAAIAITFGRLNLLSGNKLFEASNEIKERYNRHPNFVHFVVDGNPHTFLHTDDYYTTTTGGDSDTMATWTRAVFEHQAVQSACNGPQQKNGGDSWLFKNTNYCYRELYPKTLSVR